MPSRQKDDMSTLTYIINHVFLPPKLPQNDLDDLFKNEDALIAQCRAALEKFGEVSNVGLSTSIIVPKKN